MAYHVVETPAVRYAYAEAPTELLTTLAREVYPVLRADPTNADGRHPIRYEHSWWVYEVTTRDGGLFFLVYQAIEDPPMVLVYDLVAFRET